MIEYLLDTDVCIAALKRRDARLVDGLKSHDGRVAVSDITLSELHYGAELYEKPAERIQLIETFMARLEVLPFASGAARHAGQIRATLKRQGRLIGAYDLLIAGTARNHGLVLVTNNVRAFSRVEGLRTENWLAR